MTYSRLTEATAYVTGWRLNHPEPTEDRVVLSVQSATAHLTADDAAELGTYLLDHARAIREALADKVAAGLRPETD